jgi:hypothetical protein
LTPDLSSEITSNGNPNGCYWITTTDSQIISGYRGLGDSSIALTQSQMVQSASFNGFSFAPDSAWTIDEGKSYPLRKLLGG